MKIPALDLKKQIMPIRAQLEAAIKEVIDNTSFVLGAGVDKFEQDVEEYSGAKYAIGVSNGTDAISLALLALGVGPGDGVICPTFTYYASAGAAANIGARPVFADIDQDTYNISLKSVEKILVKKNKLKIKAIIPVHLYGACAEMEGILKLAAKYKIKVVEDTAQAFGSQYKGKSAGTWGDCGAVSFYPGKNLGAFGDAGLILTNNKAIGRKLKVLRNQGNENKYYHLVLGRNNRLDTIQAAVLDIKLKYLDQWNKARQEIAQYYNNNLSGLGIKLPVVPDNSTHIYHQYVLRASGSSKLFMNYLQSKGIDSRVFYPVPLHLQKCFKYLGYKPGDFPQAEAAARQVFTLPIYPELTKEEKDYIIQSVKEFAHG
ncbi:MAG TPA: DegT/DnrJ/EryC1/StrS family aminotransferase [Candidatus Omnitrophota bacterium]|nr:DegT/DnrJ/EryC1/StrS family aminotransferase [Candidatus Omnitrophota bacterium]HPT39623.1 DegT/DnrJ/EryC1/StrS family aminotransferase [Candidatus Omnitrophota bacterium]